MVDYVKLAATAQRLIDKNGRLLTLVQFDTAVDDPAKPWRANTDPRDEPEATLQIKGVFVPPSSASQLGLRADTQDLVKRVEQIIIVASTADLSDYQEVIDDSERYKILFFEKLKPADTTLLYYFGVRK